MSTLNLARILVDCVIAEGRVWHHCASLLGLNVMSRSFRSARLMILRAAAKRPYIVTNHVLVPCIDMIRGVKRCCRMQRS